MGERLYWLGFSLFPGIGPIRFASLLDRFGSAEASWNASKSELAEIVGDKISDKFIAFRNEFIFEKIQSELENKHISFLTLFEKDYPSLLRSITNPPIVLFVKGRQDFNDTNHQSIGIVGTRKITTYGREVTEMITRELVSVGCSIVSGLALGVDAVAHQTTLQQKGKTIAVLGCGVDLCYPSTNQAIYYSILSSGGAVVSEYPPGQPPSIGSFPSRNRIIAGISRAVVVTEGAEDSGALITAKEAIKNGRKVFAVPGPITSGLSKGPLKLLREGAVMVTSGEDILKELGVEQRAKRIAKKEVKGETEEEQKIIDALCDEGMLFDELVRLLQLSPTSLATTLTLLEMRGIVRSAQGKFYLVAS